MLRNCRLYVYLSIAGRACQKGSRRGGGCVPVSGRKPILLEPFDRFRQVAGESSRGEHVEVHPKRRARVLTIQSKSPRAMTVALQAEGKAPIGFRGTQRGIPEEVKVGSIGLF